MSEALTQGYQTWQLMSQGPKTKLYRPSEFTTAFSEGIRLSIEDKAIDEIVREGFEARQETSLMIDRDDGNHAYMAGFIAHLIAYHLRKTESQEQNLVDEVTRARKGEDSALLHSDFWHQTIRACFEEMREDMWLDLRLKTTQTVIKERGKGVIAALRALRSLQDLGQSLPAFRNMDLDTINILDIGGSTGFTNLPLLESDEFGIEHVTILDNYDETMTIYTDKVLLKDRRLDRWIISTSTPLDSLSPESIKNFNESERRIFQYAEDGRIGFNRVTTGVNPLQTLASKSRMVDGHNVVVCSTMLHQLTKDGRNELYNTIREFLGESRDWVLVVNDYARIDCIANNSLTFIERWHTESSPYRTFIGGVSGGSNPSSDSDFDAGLTFHEVVRWGDSRCNEPTLSEIAVYPDLDIDLL